LALGEALAAMVAGEATEITQSLALSLPPVEVAAALVVLLIKSLLLEVLAVVVVDGEERLILVVQELPIKDAQVGLVRDLLFLALAVVVVRVLLESVARQQILETVVMALVLRLLVPLSQEPEVEAAVVLLAEQ
jgi:hypothetical protein